MTAITALHPWNQAIADTVFSDKQRQNHALLFSGSQGLGKIDLAQQLAEHTLNNTSQSASLLHALSHPDLHVIMPEAKVEDNLLGSYAQRYLTAHSGKPRKAITIDQVRSLRDALSTHPHISEVRVILVLHAETMNSNAANGLLKNLEEPPANTLFILTSDAPEQLPATIRSRCSELRFNAPSTSIGREWLKQKDLIPEADIDAYLATANDCPLLAVTNYEAGFIDDLKTIFGEVNQLWQGSHSPLGVAAQWQDLGGLKVANVLQQIISDLIRLASSKNVANVHFPVQRDWLYQRAIRFSIQKLFALYDSIISAKSALQSNSDELLILEDIAIKIRRLSS